MNATGKLTSPEDFEVTITLTCKISELRQIKALNEENGKADNWPLSEFTAQIRKICKQVDRVYSPETPDIVECRECGHENEL
jgi:hypothetical protein